ncbi:TPA: hypothetical protein H1008_03070 [archaeon]|nr:hypothetical protein [Candidatus Undinarchaeales archaeon SRR5007147.bin71]
MKLGNSLLLLLIVSVSGCISQTETEADKEVEVPHIPGEPAIIVPHTQGERDIREIMEEGKQSAEFDIENEEIPKFVDENFIELDKIKSISKFRGGYGHDFSAGTGESCRSMKHYFWPAWGEHGKTHNPSWMSIEYYSPVDGVIEELQYRENAYGTEAQFHIVPDEEPAFLLRFFHLKLLDSLGEGSRVSAGQKIGTIGDENSHAEIAVELMIPDGSTIISFFQIMSDSVFEEYAERGMTSREDVIISKEERDADPLECDYSTEAGYFVGRGTEKYDRWSTSSANWLMLN